MRFACETPRPGPAAAFALQLQGELPLLVTDRLLLRAPKVEDFEAFARIACSARGQYLGGPMTREDAWSDFTQMTATWLLHGHGVWTIGRSGEIAGFVLLGFEPGDLDPELGFLLLPEAEGEGIAFEAATAARSHAFDSLGWTALVSYIDPANTRAQRLADRLGGVRDGMVEDAQVWRYGTAGLAT
ncbi:GNAT family N-acetyltransferase [Roseobacter sinensis]|uniref:GNAT family N-acetyltransferase n=1 Tax=Roseobacter sinensis TaxID=2931391 RepID=A0ABT3BDX8_9RHOB|nr:GNAT family N-acetyltransferase [Roseobacter sp. WL0113]MCV3271781.1 GNAT family N-acetyltransferase [Roseobacter sp. WL0113]